MQFTDRLARTRTLKQAFNLNLEVAWRLIKACEKAGMVRAATLDGNKAEDIAFARLCYAIGNSGADTVLAHLESF